MWFGVCLSVIAALRWVSLLASLYPPFYESLLHVKLCLRLMNCQCGDPILLSEHLPKDSPSGCFDDLLRLPYLQTSVPTTQGGSELAAAAQVADHLSFINPQMQCSL
jgi:hypothetical protein